MTEKIFSLFVMVGVLATLAFGNQAVPMKGSGNGSIIAWVGTEVDAIGEGQATHLGKFQREEHLTLNPDGTFTGTITFTAADASELTCDVAGGFTSQTTAAGTYTFTGGTGRFVNATGEAFFNVTLTGPTSFDLAFTGSIDLH